MIRLTISVTLGILACACSQPETVPKPARTASQPVIDQKPAIDLSTVEIKLERTECYGWCPSYELTISGNGLVRYTGRKFVKEIGERSATLPERTIRDLVTSFENVDFFDLKDGYTEGANDISSTVLSLRIGAKSKRIEDLWIPGDRVDSSGNEIPYWQVHESLEAIALAIDHAVKIDSWIGTEAEREALFGGTKR